MDSFRVIRAEDASEELCKAISSIEPVAEEYASSVWRSIKTAQMMEDRWQLFEMFCWNYDRYSEGLESYVNDCVMTAVRCAGVEQVFQRTRIDVNCFAVNLISSGVTLTESLRCFMRAEVDEGNPDRQQFENWLEDLFDKGGVYALLAKLRDEAQHGQPLVSLYVDERGRFRACFDLDQLMNPEHFTIKGSFKRLMKDKLNQMDDLDARHHRLSYTWCMERYFIEVMEVVATFYSCSSAYIQEGDKLLYDCIKANPACCGELKDGRKVIWVLDGEVAHPLIGVETPGYEVHTERKGEVENRLENAKRRFNRVVSEAAGPSGQSA